jgi:hypothetical protein
VLGAAIALPALVGGIVSVTGSGSFWHGVVVMAVFNVVLLVVLAAVVIALARRDSLGPRAR